MTSFGIVVMCACFSVASCQFLNCDWVASLDCATYSPFQECGTDGVTYGNRCWFAKAQCINADLHILHDGACTPAAMTTTPVPNATARPNTSVDGAEAVLDFFCTQLSKEDCEDKNQPVCATDGWTYKNYCEYDKARCTHRDLHVKNFGPCI